MYVMAIVTTCANSLSTLLVIGWFSIMCQWVWSLHLNILTILDFYETVPVVFPIPDIIFPNHTC